MKSVISYWFSIGAVFFKADKTVWNGKLFQTVYFFYEGDENKLIWMGMDFLQFRKGKRRDVFMIKNCFLYLCINH